MVGKNAKDFFLSKIIFPNILITDQPGVIISKSLGIFGNRKRRMIYDFEDILADLQLETIKKLGDKQASELFYKIGKDVGAQYQFFMGKRKIPKFLRKGVIEYFFTRLNSVGMSFGKKVIFNEEDNSLTLEGKDTLICRKTGNSMMFAGVASGFLSSVVGKNIESEPKCKNCSEFCNITANERIPTKYIPNLNELRIENNYEKINFPKRLNQNKTTQTLNKFYNFRKISMTAEGKFYFEEKALFFSEISMLGLVTRNYLIDNKKLFERAIIKSSEKLSQHLFRSLDKQEDKIKYLQGILSAFGLGISFIVKHNRTLTVKLLYPPITKYGFLYHALELNGFLNTIYNRKFKLAKIKVSYNPIMTVLSYK